MSEQQPLCSSPLFLHLFTLCTNCGDCPEGRPTVMDPLCADESYKSNVGTKLVSRARSKKEKKKKTMRKVFVSSQFCLGLFQRVKATGSVLVIIHLNKYQDFVM